MASSVDFPALAPASVTAAVKRIVAECQPGAILAFGSRVRGQARVDSDLDLLVLTSEPLPDPSALRRRLHALLADMPFAKDILVSDPEHFAFWSLQINSVYHDASTEGIPLWRNSRLEDANVERICR